MFKMCLKHCNITKNKAKSFVKTSSCHMCYDLLLSFVIAWLLKKSSRILFRVYSFSRPEGIPAGQIIAERSADARGASERMDGLSARLSGTSA
jgi:hypothetical protein